MKKKKIHQKIKHSQKNRKTSSHKDFSGYIIITSSLVIGIFIVFLFANKRTIAQSVAGTSVMRGLYNQAIIPLPQVDGAVSYDIYYKSSSDTAFINAVRDIPANQKSYIISYLKRGTDYQYEISAVNGIGSEFWFSEIQPMTNLKPM